MALSFSSLVGYDAALISKLEDPERRALRTLGKWFLVPCFAMGASAALFTWIIERSLVSAALIGFAALVLVLNLLRLVVSGGGAAAQYSKARAEKWAPTLAPLLVLFALGACFAQPVLLATYGAALEPQIERYRAELMLQHQGGAETEGNSTEVISGAGSTEVISGAGSTLQDAAEYRQRLAACAFVTRRLALLWHKPVGAFLFTAVFAILCLSPLLLGHTTRLKALRAYELLRWQEARAVVVQSERELQHQVGLLLAQWSQNEGQDTRLTVLSRGAKSMRVQEPPSVKGAS